MKILTFIFNWRGQYDKTIEKINQLREIGVEPIVINSDDDHKDYDWHNIGEDSYFTAQFMKALELFHLRVMYYFISRVMHHIIIGNNYMRMQKNILKHMNGEYMHLM